MRKEIFICHKCIGEKYVASCIKEKGNMQHQCTYCKRKAKNVGIDFVGDMMHHVFLHSYRPNYEGSIFYEHERGDCAKDLIFDELKTDDDIASDIYDYLCAEKNPRHTEDLMMYDDDINYLREGLYNDELDLLWGELKLSLQTQARFFNIGVKDFLDDIFSDIETIQKGKTRKVVNSLKEETVIYRARVFETRQDLKMALTHPEKEFGPPPSDFARAGRMNAAGIPVFYGASSPKTCISEVRPAVGSYVVVAPFILRKTLKLFDISSLKNIKPIKGSHFNPQVRSLNNKIFFLRTLARTLTRPVSSKTSEFEYLITQAISEYLTSVSDYNFDGVVFNSTQVVSRSGRDEGCKNIVLFNKSSKVKNAESNLCRYKVKLYNYIENERRGPHYEIRKINNNARIPNIYNYFDGRSPSVLELDAENIVVHQIKGFSFITEEHPVKKGDDVIHDSTSKNDNLGDSFHEF